MRIKTSSKKQTALNLNIYRNLHHRSHHALKKKFEDLAKTLLKDTPPLGRIRLHYSVCPKTKRRLDIANVCSVIDKYFSDALTANGIIEDDDYTHLDFVSFGFGGLADQEHVLVTITEIEERDPMKLSMTAELSVEDVQAAIAAWVATETGQETSPADVTVTPDGATVSIGEELTPDSKPKTKKTRRTKAQIAADNKAAEEAEKDGSDDTNVPDSSDSDGGGSDQDSEAQVEDSSKAAEKSSEDQKPKNDSTESPEGSSQTDGDSAETEKAPVKPKKSSIFAQ